MYFTQKKSGSTMNPPAAGRFNERSKMMSEDRIALGKPMATEGRRKLKRIKNSNQE
jgi:hypothetical protein